MQFAKWLSVAALLVSAAGCATAAHGSAPGPDGTTVYVGGQKAAFFNSPATMWSCPAQHTGEQCKQVKVEVQK